MEKTEAKEKNEREGPTESEEKETREENKEAKEKPSGVFDRSEYAKKEFWDERFLKTKGSFDWYLEYDELKNYFQNIYKISKSDKILMVGCGNSRPINILRIELGEQMFLDGYHDVLNIDISEVCIEKMRETYKKQGLGLQYPSHSLNLKSVVEVMDATKMTYPSGTFDALIDKGTLDALLCSYDSDLVFRFMREMARVTKPGGKIFVITHGSPQGRQWIFDHTIDPSEFSVHYTKQRLSSMSQFINILRANLKNRPLVEGFRDKAVLMKSMFEWGQIDKLIVKFCKKALGESTELPLDPSKLGKMVQMPEVCAENEGLVEEKAGSGNLEEEINKEVEKEKEKEKSNEEKNLMAQANDKQYNPKRQSFCYIYLLEKRLKPNEPTATEKAANEKKAGAVKKEKESNET